MFNRLAQFRSIKTPNQIRHFVNYLIWELNILVHEAAEGEDYVDAQGKRYLNTAEASVYDALIEQCWHVDVCCLKEAVALETRAKTLLENIRDDEFISGHDAAEAAQEWARTSIPLHLMEGYWSAGCFDPGDTDRMYRNGIKPEQCADVIDVGGELMTVGYAACMRLPL